MAHNSFRAVLASRVKIRFNAPLSRFAFQPRECATARNFYARIFSQREFSSRQEYYQDFASSWFLARIPDESFFWAGSWRVQISRQDSYRDKW